MRTPRLLVTAFLAALPVLGACGSTRPPTDPSPSPAPSSPAAEPTTTASTAEVTPDEVSPAARARHDALARDAEQLFAAFGNGAPRLSADGKSLVFRSNRDGLPLLYVAPASDPRAAPRKLLANDERITSFEMIPGRDALVYASDRGADENFSLFAVGLDGRAPRELTPGEALHRDRPIFARKVPGVVYFSARSKKESTTRVYAVRVDGSEPPRLLYTDPGVAFLQDVAEGGASGLLVRVKTLSTHELVRVDLRAGTGRTLYPTSGAAAVHAAALTPDGTRAVVATDGGGEANLVLQLQAETGDELARHVDDEPSTGNTSDLALSNDGKTLALLIDAGNRHFVRFVDTRTMKRTRAAKLPLGDGDLGAFSADDRQLLVRWATPTRPGDVFSVAVATGEVTPLRDEPRSGLDGRPELDIRIEGIPAFDGLTIPVNTYVPKGATRLPVIVMVHGGPASSSTVTYSPLVRFYTSHGFAVVEPNVRGSTGFGRAFEQADDGPRRLDALKDLESVARWTRERPWADPDRLVLWGGSYGGYMVLMGMTRQTALWSAGVDLVGPSSWRSFMASTSGDIRAVLSRELGSVETDGAFLDSISPLADMDRVVRPLFVFQGANDPRVPRSESDQIVRSLRERRVPVEYMLAHDEGHSLDRRPNQIAFVVRTTTFLQQHLGMSAR